MSSKSKVTAAFLAALVLLALVGAFSYQAVSRFTATVESLDRSHDALVSLEAVFTAVKDAEAAARAYALTGQESFLGVYRDSAQAAQEKLAAMRGSVEIPRYESLDKLVYEQLASSSKTVAARRDQGQSTAARLVSGGAGQRAMAALRKAVAAAERDVQIQLLQRAAQADVDAVRAQWALLFGTLLALLVTASALIVIRREIRAHVRSETSRRSSEDRFERFFENANDIIQSVGTDGRFIYTNRKWHESLGYGKIEAAEMNLLAVIAPEAREHCFAVFQKLMAGEAVPRIETVFIAKDGRRVEVEGQVDCEREDGRPVATWGIFRDLTQRNKEQQRRELQYRTALILAGAADLAAAVPPVMEAACRALDWDYGAMWVKDGEAGVLRLSQLWNADPAAFLEFESLSRQTEFRCGVGLPGRVWASHEPAWVPDVTVDPNFPRAPAAVRVGLHAGLAFPILLRGGIVGVIEFFSRRIAEPEEDVLKLMTAIGSQLGQFAERLRVERDLIEARDAALAAARAKADFLANMSHEIRTPLNGVIGMTGMILDTELNPQQDEYARTIRSSGEALLEIINDILDFSKIESGKMALESYPFDLRETLESSVELIAPRAHAKGLEITAFAGPDVPVALRGDQGRLRQVLLNFLSNAVKFTESGEVSLRATSEEAGDGRVLVRLAVKDTGIGIPPEVQRRLFQAFTQADGSTSRRYGGTGLGLAISRQLVELMGGQVGLESVVGAGSTFWAQVPFEKHSEPAVSAPRKDLSGLRALIVDDNATNREILIHQLSTHGMSCSVAGAADEALALLKAEARNGRRFDIVLTDYHMPRASGLDLARSIQREPALASSRVVMMSSLGQPLPAGELREAGLAGSLTKPVRQSVLFECLGRAVSGEAPRAETPSAAATVRPARDYFRILVAEDNAVNQKLTLLQLKKMGYSADMVANGAEALEALSRVRYDLVLMDCQMPEMDGYAATEALRRREGAERHTPVVAMTASALEGDRQKCLAAGMDDYLSKPVDVEELAGVLGRWDVPVDPKILGELKLLTPEGAPASLRPLIEEFLRDTQKRMEKMRRAVAESDAKAMSEAAHALRGASGSLGARRVAGLCARLESLGRTGSVEGADQLLAALDAEFALARDALRREIGS